MKELYSGVNFYGHGSILKKYSKFPSNLPLPVSIQHGWMQAPIKHDAPSDAPENWYWSSDILSKYKRKYPYINGRAVGAPFLYCISNSETKISRVNKEGSIVFPAHSTDKHKVNFKYDEYSRQLRSLPAKFHPITVCVYHNEIKEGRHEIFKRNGFEIVCNGYDPLDDSFLYNLISNLEGKKYLFSNSWTSAIHYAAVLGLQIYLYGPVIEKIESSDDKFDLDYVNRCWRDFDNFHRVFYEYPNVDSSLQKKIAERELGVKFFLSRKTMHHLMWRCAMKPSYFVKMIKSNVRIKRPKLLARI